MGADGAQQGKAVLSSDEKDSRYEMVLLLLFRLRLSLYMDSAPRVPVEAASRANT